MAVEVLLTPCIFSNFPIFIAVVTLPHVLGPDVWVQNRREYTLMLINVAKYPSHAVAPSLGAGFQDRTGQATIMSGSWYPRPSGKCTVDSMTVWCPSLVKVSHLLYRQPRYRPGRAC